MIYIKYLYYEASFFLGVYTCGRENTETDDDNLGRLRRVLIKQFFRHSIIGNSEQFNDDYSQ